jgi:hypothetical protein
MIAAEIVAWLALGGAAVFLAAGLGTQWALARHDRRRQAAAARRLARAGMIRAARPAPGQQWPAAHVYACGCAITYHADGAPRFASCAEHSRHHSWRAWEAELGDSK